MAKTSFSGPVNSLNGFMQPVNYILGATTTSVVINPGVTYVIIAEDQGGPTAACTLVLPEVVSGAFSPAYGNNQPADQRYNGIRGQVFNQSTTLTHVLDAFGSQTINGLSSVNIEPSKVVQWSGNGNENAPWIAIESSLAN
jgi:hypothetical protein